MSGATLFSVSPKEEEAAAKSFAVMGEGFFFKCSNVIYWILFLPFLEDFSS